MINSIVALNLQLDTEVIGIDGVSDMDHAMHRLIELCIGAIGMNESGVLILSATYTRGGDNNPVEYSPEEDDEDPGEYDDDEIDDIE